jgi:Fic family protein
VGYNPKMNKSDLLPPKGNIETKTVLKKVAEAHRYLAELKGVAHSIPNQNILIDTLALQEARESSAIENIVSTFDEVYQSNAGSNNFSSPESKEVHAYAKALKTGFELVKKTELLTSNHILKIQSIVENNKAGFRKLPGTKLLNEATGEVVYMPPQDHATIIKMMDNLQSFINNDRLSDMDPLVKMAIIHHQFESIHPFYDGNGRTGRIINILYLIKNDLLSLPILYLSRYIIRHKSQYYKLLQEVRNTKEWEAWILFILEAVIITSKDSIRMVNVIDKAMQEYKSLLREKAPKIYSQDLLNNLFRYPYTKIEYLVTDLGISRNTAIRYLEILEKLKVVAKKKVGRDNFFVNKSLIDILINPKWN